MRRLTDGTRRVQASVAGSGSQVAHQSGPALMRPKWPVSVASDRVVPVVTPDLEDVIDGSTEIVIFTSCALDQH